MTNKNISFELGQDYLIKAIQNNNEVKVTLTYQGKEIGRATLITDYIDSACVTEIELADEHIHQKIYEQHSLGDTFVKFLIKFPLMPRKLEFRFIFTVPENLIDIVKKHNFLQSSDSEFENTIMLRKHIDMLPGKISLPSNITISRNFSSDISPELLPFLSKNAYWQSHLVTERLELLVENALCFIARDGEKLVGFARVLTDRTTFGSLWDVVVDENYRNQGIATNLMHQVFSCEEINQVKNFVLFTDTAKKLYQKFGFVGEDENEEKNNFVHKFRLQEKHPSYMIELIEVMKNNEKNIFLPPHKSLNFLFRQEGKRAQHTIFWKEILSPAIQSIKHPIVNENVLN